MTTLDDNAGSIVVSDVIGPNDYLGATGVSLQVAATGWPVPIGTRHPVTLQLVDDTANGDNH